VQPAPTVDRDCCQKANNNRACLTFDKSREGRLEIAIGASFHDSDLQPG